MTEWVSQGDAVRLLAEFGDVISQQALSQYLGKHPEVPRQVGGPGRPTKIDFSALRRSRETRLARGPAEKPDIEQPELAAPPALTAAKPEAPVDEFGRRRAKADVERAEHDARRARVLADEAEGRVVNRDVAISAFMTVGASIVQAFEQHRRQAVEELLAAKDEREALIVMRAHERRIRAALAASLTGIADQAEQAAVVAA